MSRNSQLAKNTAYLYFRMLLIMGVQFFTVRVTLKYLGVSDYGIYNVVCGVTNVFSFLTHTMTSASQRFLAYDLGKGNLVLLKKTFDTFVSLFSVCGFIGVIVLGGVGLWFIQTHLVIPSERMDAAVFAFYFTLAALFVQVFVLPFSSLIIAHEDMKAFAFVSVIDALMKLLIVYCLIIIPLDKLEVYAVLMFVAYLLPSAMYVIFCFRKYREVTLKRDVDWSLSKKIVPFMSWNLLGGLSGMLYTQGLSIVINMFFGPLANAAKAIADKVNGAINGFSNNFMMAVQPQIVKTYANNGMEEMHKVIYLASRMSFFLMLILALPIAINADEILDIWLVEHSALTTSMLQLILLYSLLSSLENPINQSIRATGNIRDYQIYVGLITFLVVPLAYVFFSFGFPAYYGYIALMVVYGLAYILRLYYLRKQINITYSMYFKYVIKSCVLSLAADCTILYFISLMVKPFHINALVSWIVCAFISLVVVILLGLNKDERKLITMYIHKK